MKIFKIVLSNGDPIAIYDTELSSVLDMIESGKKLVVTKRGVFNPSFMVSIIVHKELMEEAKQIAQYEKTFELSSPFVEALADRLKMLK